MKKTLKNCLLVGLMAAPLVALADTATLTVESASHGLCYNGAPIAADRTNPDNGLDAVPDGDMFSLGFLPMGEMVVGIDPPMAVGEIELWETTYRNGSYCLETADVFVRGGDSGWVFVGTADNERGANSNYHLSTLAFDAQYVGACIDGLKIVHTTTPEEAGAYCPTGDGFDVDALLVSGLAGACGEGTADAVERPATARLAGNYPNPFNPATTIRFTMDATGPARLSVRNLAGQTVAVLVDGLVAAGEQEAVFDAAALPSGLYISTLETASGVFSNKMILAK